MAGFAVNAILSRLLEPADVGLYFLAVSVVMAGVTVGQAGLQLAVVRMVAAAGAQGNDRRARSIPGKAIFLACITSGAVALLVLGLGDRVMEGLFGSARLSGLLWHVAAWTWLLSCSSVISESLRGFHAYGPATMLGGVFASCLALAALVLLQAASIHLTLDSVLEVSIAAVAVNIVVALRLLHLKTRDPERERVEAGEILRAGIPLMITGAAVFILMQADLWIIGTLGTKEQVAIYGTANRLCQFVFIPLLIGNAMLPPFIAELYAQKRLRELERVIRTVSTIAALCAFVPLVAILALAPEVLRLVYGPFYAAGAHALAILSLGQAVNVLTGSAMFTLMMTGYQKDAMAITLVFGLATILAAATLAGNFGPEGVAAAFAAGTASSAMFALYWTHRRTGVWTHVGGMDPRHVFRQLRAARVSR